MSPEKPRKMCTTDAVIMAPWDALIVTLNRCLRKCEALSFGLLLSGYAADLIGSVSFAYCLGGNAAVLIAFASASFTLGWLLCGSVWNR
jgi:hypothetical protein